MKKEVKQQFIKTAEYYSTFSKDPHKKVGCLLIRKYKKYVGEMAVYSIQKEGYNHLPNKLRSLGYKNENDKTRPEVIHAEIHALQGLMDTGKHDHSSYELVCTLSPCFECARMIYLAGIKRVYFKEYWKDRSPLEFLEKVGVKCEQIL